MQLYLTYIQGITYRGIEIKCYIIHTSFLILDALNHSYEMRGWFDPRWNTNYRPVYGL